MIQQLLNIDNYATEERKARRKGSKSTQEFFTPYEIVKRMADKIPESTWADPAKTFLEPCFGNGQFVLYIIWNRIQHGIDWETALRTLYGVELMQDNVDECKERIHKLLEIMDLCYDKEVADEIMEHNLVCSNFWEWDFENWKYIEQ
jgi:hypothetical protein